MSSPTVQRTFFKDLQHLYRTINASTDGQAGILAVDDMSVRLSLTPKSGHNAHAEFLLTLKCCDTYPKDCPEVLFHTPVFHPNIDPFSHWVCCTIIYNWCSGYSLLDLVKAVLYLIEHPNYESPNNDYGMLQKPGQLRQKTMRLLAGLSVKGRQFAPNLAWCEWARANGCLPTNEAEEDEEEEEEGEGGGGGGGGGAGEEVDQAWKQTEALPRYDAVGDDMFENRDHLSHTNTLSDLCDESFYSSTETIPSFANARYSIDVTYNGISSGRYVPNGIFWNNDAHRVALWHPGRADTFTVYYFFELAGGARHRGELGDLYDTLYSGSVNRIFQVQPDTRQTSSRYQWFEFSRNSFTVSFGTSSRHSSNLHLDNLFAFRETESLTHNFCPWSRLDGKGTKYLLEGIFCQKHQQVSDIDDASEMSDCLTGIEGLFHCDPPNNAPESADSQMPPNEDDFSTQSEELNDVKLQSALSLSSVLTAVNPNDEDKCSLMKDCINCESELAYTKNIVNTHLAPAWGWIFRQTRWSIRFAPQQSVDLSTRGIGLPAWRVSTARLMADICHFCQKTDPVSSIVLLDPMALSPLSPIVNLMRHHETPKPHLTGVLWMTALEALSPFYRVPVPTYPPPLASTTASRHLPILIDVCRGDEEVANDSNTYPSPVSLRFLALTAFLANWMAWLSRMEAHACLGKSRLQSIFLSDSVAASLLQPCSLGCGQIPLLDLWPLWLVRRLLVGSLQLSRLHRGRWRHLFPFSDMDEI